MKSPAVESAIKAMRSGIEALEEYHKHSHQAIVNDALRQFPCIAGNCSIRETIWELSEAIAGLEREDRGYKTIQKFINGMI
jgi:hypothetical protein